jgi:hypothetical protein
MKEFETYEVIKFQRPGDEGTYSGLIVGSCDTSEIFTVICYVDISHQLGPGWITRYVGKNSIIPTGGYHA